MDISYRSHKNLSGHSGILNRHDKTLARNCDHPQISPSTGKHSRLRDDHILGYCYSALIFPLTEIIKKLTKCYCIIQFMDFRFTVSSYDRDMVIYCSPEDRAAIYMYLINMSRFVHFWQKSYIHYRVNFKNVNFCVSLCKLLNTFSGVFVITLTPVHCINMTQ